MTGAKGNSDVPDYHRITELGIIANYHPQEIIRKEAGMKLVGMLTEIGSPVALDELSKAEGVPPEVKAAARARLEEARDISLATDIAEGREMVLLGVLKDDNEPLPARMAAMAALRDIGIEGVEKRSDRAILWLLSDMSIDNARL